MSESAISIRDVTKKFRRFQHPGWRALDALGVSVPRRKFDEFIALHDIDLEIKRGEKVALIGRNGAGKSTLLRVISGQMQPDSGQLTINGNVQALMELGTGFHPDFTGIDNIRSSLAHQGVSPSKVARLIDEIVDFTELDDFISRPVREYSAGMYARLAFAVATTITPEILIIDEILGAGDAYFVGKSIQRMKDLTNQGATILFVSHDMSAVQLLCDRGIWIEKGVIKADGDILTVSKAYLASVRADEEIRVRARSMSMTRTQIASNVGRSTISIYRLIGFNGQAPADPAAVSAIRFGYGEETAETISADGGDHLSRMIVEHGATNWSNTTQINDRVCMQFGEFGGKFVHAPWQIDWSERRQKRRWIEVDYLPSASDSLALEEYDEVKNSYIRLAEIGQGNSDSGWETIHVDIEDQEDTGDVGATPHTPLDMQVLLPDDRYGEGSIQIASFAFFDQADTRRHTLVTGEFAKAIMIYIADENIKDPVAVLAIYRPDGSCAMQVTSNRENRKLGVLAGQGQIIVSFTPLLLGPGDYIVSIALFKELNLASSHEPAAYDLHDRCYKLKVLPPAGIGIEIGTVNQPATWDIAS